MKGGDFSWPPVGTFRGHQRGPQLATSGYFLMATDIGDDLHSNILVLELIQSLRVVRLYAAKLTLPTMPSRLSDLEVTADLGQVFALVEHSVALGELYDYLLGGVVL